MQQSGVIQYHPLPNHYISPLASSECKSCSSQIVKSTNNSNNQTYVCESCVNDAVSRKLELIRKLKRDLAVKKETLCHEYQTMYYSNRTENKNEVNDALLSKDNGEESSVVEQKKIQCLTHPTQRTIRLKKQREAIQDLKYQIARVQEENRKQRDMNAEIGQENVQTDQQLKEAIRVLKSINEKRRKSSIVHDIQSVKFDDLCKIRRDVCLHILGAIPVMLRPIGNGEDNGDVSPIGTLTDLNHGVYRMYILNSDTWIAVVIPKSNLVRQSSQSRHSKSPPKKDSSVTSASGKLQRRDGARDLSQSMMAKSMSELVNAVSSKDVAQTIIKMSKNDKDTIGTALGHIVLVLDQMSSCLDVPLPNRMKFMGSYSTVYKGAEDAALPLYYNQSSSNQSINQVLEKAMKAYSLTNLMELFTYGLGLLSENIVALCAAQGILVSPYHTHNFAYNLLCLYHLPIIGHIGPLSYYDQESEIGARNEVSSNYYLDKGNHMCFFDPIIERLLVTPRKPKPKPKPAITSPSIQATGLLSEFINERYLEDSMMYK